MRRFLIAFVFCLPGAAFALGDTGTVYLTNTNIQVIHDGTPRAYIYVPVSIGGCTNNAAAQLVMDSSNSIATTFYATLLSAKATGQGVNIQTLGCSEQGYPLILAVFLET
jgi:hypothetical protein